MLVNNRRNPFLTAPALVLFALLFLGLAGLIPLHLLGGAGELLITALFVTVALGVPIAAGFYLRGNILPYLGFRSVTKNGVGVSLAASAVLLLGGLLVNGGFFADAYRYREYALYGMRLTNDPKSFGGVLLVLLVLVVLPVFLEGLLFRGVLLFEYRHGGVLLAATVSSLLYAMLSMEFTRFPIRFLTGMILSLVVFLTRNILLSMLTHAVSALFAVFFEKYVIFIAKEAETRVLFFFVFGALFLLSLFIFARYAEKMLRERGEQEEEIPKKLAKHKRPLVLYDVCSAPTIWADAFGFILFAVLGILL